MNRRDLLKGLGRAVTALAVAPWVSLLPKALPIVHAAGGIPMSNGLHHFTFYQGRLLCLDYGKPHLIYFSRPISQPYWGWAESASEEELRKSPEFLFENNVLTPSDETEENTEED